MALLYPTLITLTVSDAYFSSAIGGGHWSAETSEFNILKYKPNPELIPCHVQNAPTFGVFIVIERQLRRFQRLFRSDNLLLSYMFSVQCESLPNIGFHRLDVLKCETRSDLQIKSLNLQRVATNFIEPRIWYDDAILFFHLYAYREIINPLR